MSFSRFMALHMVPLLLRLGLGIVFLWAGSSKLSQEMEVVGEDAAVLANLGIISPSSTAPQTDTQPPGETTQPAEDPAPAETPGEPPADASPATDTPADDPPASVHAAPHVRLIRAQASSNSRPFTAADFPEPVRIRRVHSVTLLLARASQPDDQGRRLWPAALASPFMLKTLSWAAALTEALGGAMLIVGFLSRLAALGEAITMLVAMLLTTIGPATISGSAFLGFLPPPHFADANWVQAWMPWLFQLLLFLMAISVVLTGPGLASIDHMLFGRRRAHVHDAEDDDDEE